MSTPATVSSAPDPIGATLLFSLLLHGVLLLGITFHFAKSSPSLPTLDVTLVNVANQETPDKADFLAQANNRGGGQSDQAGRPSQPFSGVLPKGTPVAQCFAVPRAAPALVFESFDEAHKADYAATVTEVLAAPNVYRKRFRARRGRSAAE